MFADHASLPVDSADHPNNACCAIGKANKFFTGSGDESNNHASGTLITPDCVLACRHSFDGMDGSQGELAAGVYRTSGQRLEGATLIQSTGEAICRFRKKLDGTFTNASGLCVDYYQVRIIEVWVPPLPAWDVVLCFLETSVPHIKPIRPLWDKHSRAIQNGRECWAAGWGLDGATEGVGNRPNDVRILTLGGDGTGSFSNRYLASITSVSVQIAGTLSINDYDSGGGLFIGVEGEWRVIAAIRQAAGQGSRLEGPIAPQFPIPGFPLLGLPGGRQGLTRTQGALRYRP